MTCNVMYASRRNQQRFLIVANTVDASVGILLGYGNGSFAYQTTYSTGPEPKSVAVGDFNNDTLLDIVVGNSGSNNLGVLLGRGNGTFAEMIIVSLEYGSRPFMVLFGGFNDDLKLDLAVVGFTYLISVLFLKV